MKVSEFNFFYWVRPELLVNGILRRVAVGAGAETTS